MATYLDLLYEELHSSPSRSAAPPSPAVHTDDVDDAEVARTFLAVLERCIRAVQRKASPKLDLSPDAFQVKEWLSAAYEVTDGKFNQKAKTLAELQQNTCINFEALYTHYTRTTQDPVTKAAFEAALVSIGHPVYAVSNRYFTAKRAVALRPRAPLPTEQPGLTNSI